MSNERGSGPGLSRREVLGIAAGVGAGLVVAEGGHMKAAARMDGNAAGSIEVVERKAHTSATFRAATHVVGQRAESGTQARFVSFANLPNIWMGGGGVPMMREWQMIGAIGVGGGTPEQDIVVAEAGAA